MTKRYQLRSLLSEHQSFLLLASAFVVFRLLAILSLRPGGFLVDQGPDQYYYFEMARLTGSGQLPFFDFWMEYPPLMPWLATLAYRLSLQIPVWDQPIFWFNTIFRFLLLPFDLGTLVLIYGIGQQIDGRSSALKIAGLWAVLFTPFLTLLTWFDPLTLFFLMLGLYGLLARRPLLAGTAMGLGFLAKVLPVALSPLGLFTLRSHRRRIIYVGSAVAAVALVLLPPLLAGPAYVLALFQALLNVSAWETVWALLEGYYGYGLVAPLALRQDPAAAAFSANEASLPWLPITLVFAAVYAYLITRRIDWENKRRIVQFALFSVVIFMLYSKGYSPQWATYLGTLTLVALPLGRGLGYALLLSLLMVAEWPFAFIVLSDQSWFLAALIVLRTLVLVLLGVEALVRVLPNAAGQRIGPPLFPLALSVSLAGLLLLVPPAWRAYTSDRLQADALAPFVTAWRVDPTRAAQVAVVQPTMLERLAPHLPDDALSLMPYAWGHPDPWLDALTHSHDRLWFLYDHGNETGRQHYETSRAWLEARACPALQTWYGTIWGGYYVTAPAAEARPVTAVFEDGIRLVAATRPDDSLAPGAAFCVRLSWLAETGPAQDYAVFVHVLAENGQPIAQSDTWPAAPTSRWAPGEQVQTGHGLILPANLSPGRYAVQVGLYELDSGQRLRLVDGRDVFSLGNLLIE